MGGFFLVAQSLERGEHQLAFRSLYKKMDCWIPNNSKRKDSLFLMFSRQKLREHEVEALTRWYDHDLDVFSKPVEQDVLQDLRC